MFLPFSFDRPSYKNSNYKNLDNVEHKTGKRSGSTDKNGIGKRKKMLKRRKKKGYK